MSRLADALNNFAEQTRSQGATKRVYEQARVSWTENAIADYINKRQEEVGAVITIDYIGVNTARTIVYHYDKPKED